MTCTNCQTVRDHFANDPPQHKFYATSCTHCGARLIQVIQRRLSLPADAKRERCRWVLSTWMQYGHGEAELRALAKKAGWANERNAKT